MQIASPTAAILAPLVGVPTGPDARGKAAQNTDEQLAAARAGKSENQDAPKEAAKLDNEAVDSVSVSTEARQKEASNVPAPIYAEIWKGSIKVAQVDVHGHVTSFTGMVAPGGGASVAGPLLAAQRAVQVAQQVGGEIRAAGQSLDSQTLVMRAKLASTYGT